MRTGVGWKDSLDHIAKYKVFIFSYVHVLQFSSDQQIFSFFLINKILGIKMYKVCPHSLKMKEYGHSIRGWESSYLYFYELSL
jgi:hypothetical protein